MIKLLFTRHGQTIRNVDGTIQGQEHGDLNEKGTEQIKKLAERLKDEKIDLIISSDSLRCKITSKGATEDKELDIEYTSLIREKDNGDWAGKKIKEVNWDELKGDFESRKVSNGESLIEVRERGRKFIKELYEKYKDFDTTILIVSHGAFLKILLGDLIGTSLKDSVFKLFIDHCSLTLVEFVDLDNYQIKYLNETEFLGDSRNWIEFPGE